MLIPEAPGAAQPPVLVGPARWLQVVDEQSDQYFRVTFRTRMKTALAAGTFHSVGGAELEFVSGSFWTVSYFRTLFSGPIILTVRRNTSRRCTLGQRRSRESEDFR